MSAVHAEDGDDINLTDIWLRKDPIRWAAGALAGLFAGVVMMAFAMVFAAAAGYEAWFPVKLAALPFLGNSATAFGNMTGVLVGVIAIEVLSAFLGVVYAHFTGTNHLPALLGAGFVWGTFSWIFIGNLFSQSISLVSAARIPNSATFPVLLVFGLSLPVVAFFDRTLRGRR